MLEFPRWFKDAIHMLECPACHKAVEEKHITAEGIRKSIAYKDSTAFFIEYKCPGCNNITTMELTPMTLEDFTMEMLEIFTSDERGAEEAVEKTPEEKEKKPKSDELKERKKAKKKTSESKISDEEITEIKNTLKSCKSHEDFLTSIGVTEEMRKRWEKEYEGE